MNNSCVDEEFPHTECIMKPSAPAIGTKESIRWICSRPIKRQVWMAIEGNQLITLQLVNMWLLCVN